MRFLLLFACLLWPAGLLAAPENDAWHEDFRGPTAPTVEGTTVSLENGVAHYVKRGSGWIHRLVFDLPHPVNVAEYPYFVIHAKDVRGHLFVQFKMDGAWPKSLLWTVSGWQPKEFETAVVDLRKLGKQVSAIWLNSDSSIEGAEWLIDWMKVCRDPEPVRLTVVDAGRLSEPPNRRLFRASLQNRQGRPARLQWSLRRGETALPAHDVVVNAGQSAEIQENYEAAAGEGVYIRVADAATGDGVLGRSVAVPPVLQAEMVEPSYKNTLYGPDQAGRIVVDARLNVAAPLLKGARVTMAVAPAEGAGPAGQPAAAQPAREVTRITLPAGALRTGEYRVQLALSRGGSTLATESLPLWVVPSSPIQTTLRKDRVLLVGGKPFFPLGFYDIPTEDFAMDARAGFNTVVFGGAGKGTMPRLDAAQAAGLKVVIASTGRWFGKEREKMRDDVEPIRSHPALLAWYLRDEPSTSQPECGPEEMRALYWHMHRVDPYHPAFTVFCVPSEYGLYADTMDLFATDPYPVDQQPLTLVSDWCDRASAAIDGRRALWVIPQSFGSEKGPQTWWRIPTIEEERAMTYLAIIHGAKAILYYRYDVQEYVPATKGWKSISTIPKTHPKLWEGFVGLAGEIKALSPVLMAPEPAAGGTALCDAPIHAALRDYEGRRYLLAVNPAYQDAHAHLSIPGMPAGARIHVEGSERSLVASARGFEDTFAPLAARVYWVSLPGAR